MDHVKSKLMFLFLLWGRAALRPVMTRKPKFHSVWFCAGLVLHLETPTVAG